MQVGAEPAAEHTPDWALPSEYIPQGLSREARAGDQEQGVWTDKVNNKPELTV